MNLAKETRWLCENAKSLEKFPGQWIMFCPTDGVLCKGESLKKVLETVHRKKHPHKPYIFLVPSKDQLGFPVPVIQRS